MNHPLSGDGRGGEGRVPPKGEGLEGGELVLFSIIDPLCRGTALPPRPWSAPGTASDGRVLGERGRADDNMDDGKRRPLVSDWPREAITADSLRRTPHATAPAGAGLCLVERDGF